MRRPVLLFVVNHAGFFLSHRLPIAKAAMEHGYDVHVATPRSKHVPRILEAGLQWHEFKLSRSGRNPFQELRAIADLVRLFRSVRPDISHHVTSKPVVYGTIAARIARVPAVINAISGLGHVYSETGTGARLSRAVVNRLYRMALRHPRMRVIAQNKDHARQFVENGWCRRDECVLIPGSGVDVGVYQPAERAGRDNVRVLFASRMLWTKGVGEFIEAARALGARRNGVQFVLAGEPDPDNPSSVPLAVLEGWQREGIVEYLGRRDDMAAVMADADIFCFPTYYGEGVPKVLIEAAASGLPIVTTDWPGCRDVVEDGANGFLVPIRDSAAVTTALARLVADPAARRRMGLAGRKRVEQELSLDAIVEQTLALYGDVE